MSPIFEVLTTNNKLLSELRALLNQWLLGGTKKASGAVFLLNRSVQISLYLLRILHALREQAVYCPQSSPARVHEQNMRKESGFFFDKTFIEKSTIDSNKTCNNENLAIKHLVAILQIQNLTMAWFWLETIYKFALFYLNWIIVENVKEYGNSSQKK